jgi:ribonuclease HI
MDFSLEKKEDKIHVYTDGACSNNGGLAARAGMGIYFGEDDPRNFSSLYIGRQTNNTAELAAIIQVSRILKEEIEQGKEVELYSDSQYGIRCCTDYGKKLETQGWKNGKKPVPNLELVKEAYGIYKDLSNVKFHYVPAHTGGEDVCSRGNAGADRLANLAIGVSHCPYSAESRIYLSVPFAEKNEAKQLGARWDPKRKKWYIDSTPSANRTIVLERWTDNTP